MVYTEKRRAKSIDVKPSPIVFGEDQEPSQIQTAVLDQIAGVSHESIVLEQLAGFPHEEQAFMQLDPSPEEILRMQLANLKDLLTSELSASQIDVPNVMLFDLKGNMYDFNSINDFVGAQSSQQTPYWHVVCQASSEDFINMLDNTLLKMLCALRVRDLRIKVEAVHSTLRFWVPGTYFFTDDWKVPMQPGLRDAVKEEARIVYCDLKSLKARIQEVPYKISVPFFIDMFKSPLTEISIEYTCQDRVDLKRGPLCENVTKLELKAVSRLQVVEFQGYAWKLQKVSLTDLCLFDAHHFMETIEPLEFYAQNCSFLTKPGMNFYLQNGHEQITSIRFISCLLNGKDMTKQNIKKFLLPERCQTEKNRYVMSAMVTKPVWSHFIPRQTQGIENFLPTLDKPTLENTWSGRRRKYQALKVLELRDINIKFEDFDQFSGFDYLFKDLSHVSRIVISQQTIAAESIHLTSMVGFTLHSGPCEHTRELLVDTLIIKSPPNCGATTALKKCFKNIAIESGVEIEAKPGCLLLRGETYLTVYYKTLLITFA